MSALVYVAASSRDLLRAEAAIAYARSVGLSIGYDWVASIRRREAAGLTDADLTAAERQRHALHDLAGIRDAAVVVALLSDNESEMRWEMGYAFARAVPVIVSRETSRRVRLFDALATECADDKTAIDLAVVIAGRVGI